MQQTRRSHHFHSQLLVLSDAYLNSRSVFCSGHASAPASPHPLINSQMSGLTKHHSHPLTSLSPRAATRLSEELLHVRDLCLNRTEQNIATESAVLMNRDIYIIHKDLQERDWRSVTERGLDFNQRFIYACGSE